MTPGNDDQPRRYNNASSADKIYTAVEKKV